MGCRETVRDQNDLAIRCIDGGQILPSQLQRMLDVGEVWVDLVFADIIATHIRS